MYGLLLTSDSVRSDLVLNWLFPGGAEVKNLPASVGDARDLGSIPGSGRSPGGGNGSPLQYCCLENLLDRGACLGQRLRSIGSQRVQHNN